MYTDTSEKAFGCVFRFGEKRWMEQFIKGHFNFSCAGAYIEKAEHEGNNEQGDKYEAVFARLKKCDPRINDIKKRLKEDLEIIDDGQYVLLRRQSAKYIPTFCFFAYKKSDLEKGEFGKKTYCEDKKIYDITLRFDPKMYSGFVQKYDKNVDKTDDKRCTMALIELNPFIENAKGFIKSAFGFLAGAKMDFINYEEREKDEFYIEPTGDYNELFYKRPKYRYQHEARIVLRNIRFFSMYDRYDLITSEYDDNKCSCIDEMVEMHFGAHISRGL